MIEAFFNDERHRRSEELAFDAEQAERKGNASAALLHYGEAAQLEEACARDIPGDALKVRTLLAISAVALWLRAARWDEAGRAGCAFLAEPDKLSPDGIRAIQKLVDRAWRTAEVEEALGKGGAFASLEASLSGGLVRRGLAPSTVIAERREVLAPLLMRVAELKNKRKFRRAGQSTLSNSYEILEAPALAASYGLRLYLGSSGQQMRKFEAASPKEVVEHFLELAHAVSQGAEALESMVNDTDYSQAFLRSFRDLSPDGKTVGQVDFSAMIRGRKQRAAIFTPETRERLTSSLRRQNKEQFIIAEGILKSINLRGAEPKIGIVAANGTLSTFRIAKGEHDDTIGPKLNRNVRIIGACRLNDDGEAADWADDVLLLEDALREPLA